MKLFLLCIIVFTSIKLFSQVSNSKKYDANETTLHLDDSIVYFRSSMKPFNGIIQKKNDNGKVIFECNYIDGRKDGLAKMWCSDGHLYFSGNYKNGLPNGTFEWWYANGKTAAKCSFSEGLLNGKCEEWYEEFGQLKYEENYKLGRLFGIQRYFTNEGTSVGGGDLKDGNGTISIYFENGQLASERHYINGMLDGLLKNYYENGKLDCEGYYHLGKKNGIHNGWDDNGGLIGETIFLNGKENGLKKTWSEGRKTGEYNFSNDNQDGITKIWFSDGRTLEETWSNDNRLSIKYRNKNGVEISPDSLNFIDLYRFWGGCDVKRIQDILVNGEGIYDYYALENNELPEICHLRGTKSDNPFARGGTGGVGSSGEVNGTGSEGSGNGVKSGNASGSGGGGGTRIRLNDLVLPQYKIEFDCKIYLQLTINADGDVINAKCIQSKTSCTDEKIIQDVINQIIKQVKYKKDPNTAMAITYITLHIDPQ